MKRVHLIISGRVQGVFYRYSTKQKAEQLGIKGWVRNLSNGNVEALLEGDEKNINEMISWCKKGPEHSDVTNIELISEKPINEFEDFKILR